MRMKAAERRKKLSQKERAGSIICQHCGSYACDGDYKCLNCGNSVSPSIAPEASTDSEQPIASEKIHVATLEIEHSSADVSGSNPQLGLVACPECGQRSLFWNRHDCIYRCVNPECKRAFTLEEYREKEVQRLPDKQQTEQVSSDESITEAADKPKSGAIEQIPCSEAITNEKLEPSLTEQMPSHVITTVATDKLKSNTTEQMPSDVPAAELKGEIAPGRIEEMPSDVPTTEARDEIEDGAKSAKKINRNLAFLLISVLAIGIVVLGVFLSQKSGNVDGLSAQLNKSTQALAELQTQLAVHQQDIKGLVTQVTQVQQEVEAMKLQADLSKPLTPSEPVVYSGELLAGKLLSIPIELKQLEEIRGKITGGINGIAFSIQDAGGGIVKDFGRILSSSFIFKAETSSEYNIVIKCLGELTSKYSLEYTVYRRQ